MKELPLEPSDLTWLAGLARALIGEPHAADDLVQETAMAALQGQFPDRGPRRAWLASVARRLAARRFRSDVRRERREERVARPEALPDSAELIARAEVAEQVTLAARGLDEPYRRTILLRFLEGRSPEEIAREEGVPADTVRWRVRRGLELLRAALVHDHDRDWPSWSVLLLPLARSGGDIGLATAGASGVSLGTVASVAAMKTKLVLLVALSGAGLWLAWDAVNTSVDEPRIASEASPVRKERAQPQAPLRPAAEPAELEVDRTAALAVVPTIEPVEPDAAVGDLVGNVVDEDGQPVPGATVYLIPAGAGGRGDEVLVRTSSDRRGSFRIAREGRASGQEATALDLGVVANGFLRSVVPDVMNAPNERLVVVLKSGRRISGRVIDEYGQPVRDLELLVYTAYAGIDHVSPSQRLLRAQRSMLANASSTYGQCRATTDGRGEIDFTGLPSGTLGVLPLDPGWTIEESEFVDDGGSTYVIWTAKQRLGVRLVVVDAFTGQPVDKAAATFGYELTFADGEERDFEQWVGRGSGEVSFVVDPEQMPGLEKRTITRAVFYGTCRSTEANEVDWVAEPIEDPEGAAGVVEVRVELDSLAVLVAEPGTTGEASEATAALELDVRYADNAPFEGELTVTWSSSSNPGRSVRDRPKKIGPGRYRVEVLAGDLTLQVADRYASGSLPPWSDRMRCEPDQTSLAFATLPRGSAATITRPDGWSGEWFVNASWRAPGDEEWQGSWGYSTDESSLPLTVLRPAEWRFELRRDSALERDPVVRTVLLGEEESKVVDAAR